jgi:hypothetical protein
MVMKYTKWPYVKYQMTIKFTKISHYKALTNITK